MDRFFLIAVALLTAAPVLAQPAAPPVLVTNVGEPAVEEGTASAGFDPQMHPRVWVTGEYMVGYTRPQGVPPLVGTVSDQLAANGSGQLPAGAAATPLFPNSGRLRFGAQNGVRGQIGGHLSDSFGADLGGFVLESGSDSGAFASSGSPSLVRTYQRALDGSVINLFTALPGRYAGQVSVFADTQAWGLDANLRFRGYSLYADRNDLLLGVRYLNLAESLVINERSDLNGGQAVNAVLDVLRTNNQVYVGQVGVNSRMSMGRFSLDLTEKFGLGGASQRIQIFGRNTLTGQPDQDSGLYTQPGIAGVYQRDRFVATNEFGISLGFNPTQRVNFRIGYNILWVSSVVRPGPAIDRVINDSNIRFVANPPADPNSPRPTFSWDRATTDAWIQGLTLGVGVAF